ncbi:MAG: hypothetical protein AAF171_21515 [Cyanobacteria bacterium P01_A01_bin.116]
MPRLSDRAFQIVKNEIERCYTDSPEDQIERIILLARLQTLRARKGKPLTRAQIWEELSDIAPNFDLEVLSEAANVDTDSPAVGASIGIGAVAVLVSTAIGMDGISANATGAVTVAGSRGETAAEGTRARPNAASQEKARRSNIPGLNIPGLNSVSRLRARFSTTQKKVPVNYFDTAKSIGWQAALRSQNPPHSAAHWGQTAALWRKALYQLEQVPEQNANFAAAQEKIVLYQSNLQQVEARQRAVEVARQNKLPALSSTPVQVAGNPVPISEAPKASAPEATAAIAATPSSSAEISSAEISSAEISSAEISSAEKSSAEKVAKQSGKLEAQTASPVSTQATAPTPQFSAQREDPLKVAKQYGWQAAVASQNAPHPPQQWADISRLWQTALLNLDKVDLGHPDYLEAQQVKARYEQNLAAIRQRYQQEQSANQRLQSLSATLSEIDQTLAPGATKYTQLKAIASRLQTIPAGTEAHQQAQQLIAQTERQMSAIASNTSQKVILSANE